MKEKIKIKEFRGEILSLGSSGGINSILAPRHAKPGDGILAFTAMNSRFGFKWIGKGKNPLPFVFLSI